MVNSMEEVVGSKVIRLEVREFLRSWCPDEVNIRQRGSKQLISANLYRREEEKEQGVPKLVKSI